MADVETQIAQDAAIRSDPVFPPSPHFWQEKSLEKSRYLLSGCLEPESFTGFCGAFGASPETSPALFWPISSGWVSRSQQRGSSVGLPGEHEGPRVLLRKAAKSGQGAGGQHHARPYYLSGGCLGSPGGFLPVLPRVRSIPGAFAERKNLERKREHKSGAPLRLSLGY